MSRFFKEINLSDEIISKIELLEVNKKFKNESLFFSINIQFKKLLSPKEVHLFLKGVKQFKLKIGLDSFIFSYSKDILNKDISNIDVYEYFREIFKLLKFTSKIKDFYISESDGDFLINTSFKNSKIELDNNLETINQILCNFLNIKPIKSLMVENKIKDVNFKSKNNFKGVFDIPLKPGFKELKESQLEKINQEYQNIYFSGNVLNIVSRKVKLNILNTFTIWKNKSAIGVTMFSKSKLQINEGDYIRIYGNVKYSSYKKDYEIYMIFFDLLPKKSLYDKVDDSEFKRVELHVHTKMSQMDGIKSAEDYIDFAYKLGMPGVAITDQNSVQSFPSTKYYDSKYKNFKVIYGAEISVIDDIFSEPISNLKEGNLLDNEYIFFDLETTGISPVFEDIIEFSGIKVKKGMEIDKLTFFLKPTKKIPENITRLTSITNEDVKDAINQKEGLKRIKNWIGEDILVAHNSNFDENFLNKKFNEYGIKQLSNMIIDTLRISWYLNKNYKNHRMGTIAKKQGISYDDNIAHRAEYDSRVLSKIFDNFLYILIEKGIKNFNQLSEFLKSPNSRIFSNTVNVYAKNNEGLKDLYKIISVVSTKYLSDTTLIPQILLSNLLSKRENILISTSLSEGLFWNYLTMAKSSFNELIKIYDFVEVGPPEVYSKLVERKIYTKKNIIELIKKIYNVAKENNKIVIATGNVHYIDKKEKLYYEILVSNKSIGGRLHPLFDYRNPKSKIPILDFKTTSEMLESFKGIFSDEVVNEIVVNNSLKIFNSIEKIKPLKDKLYSPNVEKYKNEFYKIISKRFVEEYGDNPNEFLRKRFDREIKAIKDNKYEVVYYLSYVAVQKSLEDDYIVGSRGSVGSSILAYLMGITEVNPLPPHYLCPKCKDFIWEKDFDSGFDLSSKDCSKCNIKMFGDGNNIPFETFLGVEGEKIPDIDLNFSSENQLIIHNFMKNFIGEKNVLRAGTISTVAWKTAYGYVHNYFEQRNESVPSRSTVELLVSKIEGVKRTTGQHPGGLIIIPDGKIPEDFTPINYPGNNFSKNWKTTHFDFTSIHDNLLKLDFLGHIDPTILKKLTQLTKVKINDIPMNDNKVYSLFTSIKELNYSKNFTSSKLGILGIPEFGTSFVRELVNSTKPTKFSDLIRISGLSHGTNVWIGNAKDLIEKNVTRLRDVISTRDDIMTYLETKNIDSKLAFKIMESVRRGKSLTLEWEQILLKHNVPEWYIESCKKIKYIFPKAHATAYVIMAYRISWFKIYYPLEYYSTYFSERDNEWDLELMNLSKEELLDYWTSQTKSSSYSLLKEREKKILSTIQIILEMYSRGITIGKISLKESKSKMWLIKKEKNELIPPFNIIQDLGNILAKKICEEREKKYFTSKHDFFKRTGINTTLKKYFDDIGILKGIESDSDKVKQNTIFN